MCALEEMNIKDESWKLKKKHLPVYYLHKINHPTTVFL